MKSHINKLKNRGYIPIEDIRDYEDLNKNELLELLKAKEAYKITIAVNLFGQNR